MITEENNIRFAKRDAKRNAISAEMMEQFNNKKDEEKIDDDNDVVNDGKERPNEETIKWLLKSVDSNILFSHLDTDQRLIVCSEMYKKTIKCDDFLISQGEEGNTFYVIEKGEFIITVKDVGQVDTLVSGRCVGELAL